MGQEENSNYNFIYSINSLLLSTAKNIFTFVGILNPNLTNYPINTSLLKYYGLSNNNQTQFKKFPLVYTNPTWDPTNKKLLWGSLDWELEKAKSRPIGTIQSVYTKYNYLVYNKNLLNKQSKLNIVNLLINKKLIWNKLTRQIEWV